jgi:hypothetical protein
VSRSFTILRSFSGSGSLATNRTKLCQSLVLSSALVGHFRSLHSLHRACLGAGGRERKVKSGALFDLALRPDFATMFLDNPPHRGKANAVAGKFCRGVKTLKGLEQTIG